MHTAEPIEEIEEASVSLDGLDELITGLQQALENTDEMNPGEVNLDDLIDVFNAGFTLDNMPNIEKILVLENDIHANSNSSGVINLSTNSSYNEIMIGDSRNLGTPNMKAVNLINLLLNGHAQINCFDVRAFDVTAALAPTTAPNRRRGVFSIIDFFVKTEEKLDEEVLDFL